MKRAIDTNILIRLIIEDVPEQAAVAQKLVDSCRNHELLIADAALIECAHVLQSQYTFDRSTVAMVIRSIVDQPAFACNRTMFREAMRHYTDKPALSFVDCCLAEYAKLEAATLLTFDKKLANQSPHARLLAA